MQWTVVIPVRSVPDAKSRLAPATAGERDHERLVAALRADTVAAVRATPAVARIVLVTDQPAGPPDEADGPATLVLVQTRPGLNAAVTEAAAHAASTWPADAIAVLLGDLPALRPQELGASLADAAGTDLGYVADHTGEGTTMLTARPGSALNPQFGPGSAARHARSATPLPAGPGLRRDVDTLADLRAAVGLGVGPATLATVASVVWGSDGSAPTPVVHLGGG